MALADQAGMKTAENLEQVAIPELEATIKRLIDYALSELEGKRIVISIEDKP